LVWVYFHYQGKKTIKELVNKGEVARKDVHGEK
jgi:hypothetical protein